MNWFIKIFFCSILNVYFLLKQSKWKSQVFVDYLAPFRHSVKWYTEIEDDGEEKLKRKDNWF